MKSITFLLLLATYTCLYAQGTSFRILYVENSDNSQEGIDLNSLKNSGTTLAGLKNKGQQLFFFALNGPSFIGTSKISEMQEEINKAEIQRYSLTPSAYLKDAKIQLRDSCYRILSKLPAKGVSQVYMDFWYSREYLQDMIKNPFWICKDFADELVTVFGNDNTKVEVIFHLPPNSTDLKSAITEVMKFGEKDESLRFSFQ